MVTTQKKNKKGKPTGKPVFSGFALAYSEAMNAATAGNNGDYQVYSKVVKKGKKAGGTTLKPVGFSVSYTAANDEVTIKVDDNVRLKITKGTVGRNLSREEEAKQEKEKPKEQKEGGA